MSKISWSKALTYYLEHEDASYDSVARKFGVSNRSVVARAVKENWQVLRQEVSLELHQKLPKKVSEDLADVRVRHAELGKRLQRIGMKCFEHYRLHPKTFSDVQKAVSLGVSLEREALGIDSKELQEYAKVNFQLSNTQDAKDGTIVTPRGIEPRFPG